MSSLRRTLSSRANGALSRGPVTLEGKQRSAMNALSHGLLARTTLMRGEWSEGLKSIFDQYVDRLAPVDAVEYGYVEEMVAACWRLRRLWAIETRTLDNEADAQDADDPVDRMAAAFAVLAEKPHPDLLHRYELRMHLTYQRALHNLILLRTAGKNEPSPISGHSEPKPDVAPSPPDAPHPAPSASSPGTPATPPVFPSRARQQAVVSGDGSGLLPLASSPGHPVLPHTAPRGTCFSLSKDFLSSLYKALRTPALGRRRICADSAGSPLPCLAPP